MRKILFGALLLITFQTLAAERPELQVGIAGHAFEHLGSIADQADVAAACGSTIIYPGGFGAIGYEGLSTTEELKKSHKSFSNYLRDAKAKGIRLAIGYVCATSIVGLEKFDRNWPENFRAQFSTPPAQWLQKDRDGEPLASWYGGDYRPACMNNPDWRAYERFIVRLQLESGHDGIFFDNPTVHPHGCYCEHCMKKFATFLATEKIKITLSETNSIAFLRQLAVNRTNDFMRFRSITARDFLAEMSSYARSIDRNALVTCNNSLNSPNVFFSQSRTYGYNIFEMSKTEDLVVVEDMVSQPRILANGSVVEYGPVYEMLQAISHRKPLVAVTLADGDYHTPPNLVRLAMAEAAAHNASYLAWPTWPEEKRREMISSIRPAADFLRQNTKLLNDTELQSDALLFLPFRRWVETADCHALKIANALSHANVQFEVVSEDDLFKELEANLGSILIVESPAVLLAPEKQRIEKFQARGGKVVWSEKENWLTEFQSLNKTPTVTVQSHPAIRAVVRDQSKKRIVHLLNLNVQRVSSFEDKVTPASDVQLKVRVPFKKVRSVKAISADAEATQGLIQFTSQREKNGSLLELTVSHLSISTMLLIE